MLLTQNYLMHIYCEVSYLASTVVVIFKTNKKKKLNCSFGLKETLSFFFGGKTKYIEEIPSGNQILVVQIVL